MKNWLIDGIQENAIRFAEGRTYSPSEEIRGPEEEEETEEKEDDYEDSPFSVPDDFSHDDGPDFEEDLGDHD